MSDNFRIDYIYILCQLMSAMTNKLTKQEAPLPQDLAEGVDEDEWVRLCRSHFLYRVGLMFSW